MPIYEYVCRECGAELEKLQRVSDAPLRECPECGKEGLSKKVSAAGFRLKGGGWYVTDFKGDKPNKPKDAKEASPGDGEKSSGETTAKSKDSTESKPAKKETKKQASG